MGSEVVGGEFEARIEGVGMLEEERGREGEGGTMNSVWKVMRSAELGEMVEGEKVVVVMVG